MTKGPLKGKDYVSFLRDLTQERWNTGAKLLGINKPLSTSNRSEQKQVLLAYMQKVVRDKMEQASAAPCGSDGDDTSS